jgi:hypothetical protein
MTRAQEERQRLSNLAGPRPVTVPSLEKLDEAVLPSNVEERYAKPVPVVETATDIVTFERSDKLTTLVDKAFDTLDECLELNDPDPDFVRMMSLRKDTALGVLNTQAKVDDTSLRRRQVDMLPKLLEIIAREEKRLPVMIEGDVL